MIQWGLDGNYEDYGRDVWFVECPKGFSLHRSAAEAEREAIRLSEEFGWTID